ncbi:Hypothetical predicted protein [Podarcis lilfordi]|nr:Hypothetical predicted protein [Podarcis lilfordi]
MSSRRAQPRSRRHGAGSPRAAPAAAARRLLAAGRTYSPYAAPNQVGNHCQLLPRIWKAEVHSSPLS